MAYDLTYAKNGMDTKEVSGFDAAVKIIAKYNKVLKKTLIEEGWKLA